MCTDSHDCFQAVKERPGYEALDRWRTGRDRQSGAQLSSAELAAGLLNEGVIAELRGISADRFTRNQLSRHLQMTAELLYL